MRIAAVVLAAILGSSLTAAAQPGMTPVQEPDDEQPTPRGAPQSTGAPATGYIVYGPYPVAPTFAAPVAPLPAPVIEGRTKSEGTATMLSLGTPAAGFALIAASGSEDDSAGMATLGVIALLVGPSAGHIYAGETGHAVGMTLVRGAAALALLAGVIKATTVYAVDCVDCSGSHYDDGDDGSTLMWVGGISLVAATVYDIIDAPRAARRRNAKERGYGVQPMMVGTSNAKSPGIGLVGSF